MMRLAPGSFAPVGLVEQGDWKLMEFFEDGRLELYKLRDDIGETKNLAAEMPERTRQLNDKLIAWRKAVHAPMPSPHLSEAAPQSNRAGKKESED